MQFFSANAAFKNTELHFETHALAATSVGKHPHCAGMRISILIFGGTKMQDYQKWGQTVWVTLTHPRIHLKINMLKSEIQS